MDITTRHVGDKAELIVKGRLDAYWADHLMKELTEVIRGGRHRLTLNLAGVDYLSSAGLRVFIQCQRQLKAIQGSLSISQPSESVRTVMALAGLDAFFSTEVPSAATPVASKDTPRFVDRPCGTFEVYEETPGAMLTCRAIGDPTLLIGTRFQEQHCWNITVPDSAFALGLGAFGKSFEECRRRFGEWLAVAGTAAYLPTDGTMVPDYLSAAGSYRPNSKLLYGLACEGPFAYLTRFEAQGEATEENPVGTIRLSDLIETCLDIADSNTAGLVMVVETATLIGAALAQSPAVFSSDEAPFEYPAIRQWLSFTPEGAHPKALALIVGVASRIEQPALSPLLRPLKPDLSLSGHFHAAAFSYRPIQKGSLVLQDIVGALFDQEKLEGILHLLNDDRPVLGAGQSEFLRGACWIGPIQEIETTGVPA
jgi:anti-anti-sigma factor